LQIVFTVGIPVFLISFLHQQIDFQSTKTFGACLNVNSVKISHRGSTTGQLLTVKYKPNSNYCSPPDLNCTGKPPWRIHAFTVFHKKMTLAPPQNLNFDGHEFHTLALNYEIVLLGWPVAIVLVLLCCPNYLTVLSVFAYMGLSMLRIGWGSDLRVQKMSTIIMRF